MAPIELPSPQLQRLVDIHQLSLVDTANHDQLVAECDYLVLFFSENPAKYPESNDVAMVLPELVKAFGQGNESFDGQLQAALVAPEAEHKLATRYGFTRWPALVFLRRGQYLGVISQIHSWEDYRREIAQLLASEPTLPPIAALSV